MRHLLTLTLLAACALPVHADYKADLKAAAKAKAGAAMEDKLGLAQTSPAGAKVYIIEPKNGATVSSPVKVVFGLSGMGVAPAGTQMEGTGHHHLLIDNPTVDMAVALPVADNIVHYGKGQTEASITLKPGSHTLQLLFADRKHQPFNPTVMSEKVTITVK